MLQHLQISAVVAPHKVCFGCILIMHLFIQPLCSVGSHMAYSSMYILRGRHYCRTSSIQSNRPRSSSLSNFAYMCVGVGCAAENRILALPSRSRLVFGVVIDIPQRSGCGTHQLRIWSIRSPVNIYLLHPSWRSPCCFIIYVVSWNPEYQSKTDFTVTHMY